jgi:hypothetical protein
MRRAAKLLQSIAVVAVAIFSGCGVRAVNVEPLRKSLFIRTYDPTLGVEQFGRVLQSTQGGESARSRRGFWNSREIRMHVAVDEKRIPALIETMRKNIRDTLAGAGARLSGHGQTEGSYRSRYEDANASGVITVGPAYLDLSRSIATPNFIVPVSIEEQWMPN